MTRTRPSLWLLGLLSLAGYLLVAAWFPLRREFHHHPLPDILAFTPSPWAALAYAGWLCLLFGLYWLAYRRVRAAGRLPAGAPIWILLAAGLFCLPLIWAFPINATDVYQYYLHARAPVFYAQSPFTVPPSAFPDDPYVPLAGEWAGHVSPYGPVWELVAAGIARLSGDDLHLALILFKGLGVICHLAAGSLVWLLLQGAPRSERTARTLLWAWNPALLLIFVVDAHNDALMICWWLLGAWLLRRRRWWGLVVLAGAPLTKSIGLLPLPFLYLATLRDLAGWRQRARWLAAGILGSLVVTLAAFAPFLALDASPGQSVVGALWRLLEEAAGGGGFSLTTLLYLILDRLGRESWGHPMLRVAAGLFLLFALWMMWRTARGANPVRMAAGTLAGYLLQAFKFRIWYAAWPWPWLLVDKEGGEPGLIAGIGFLLTAQLSVLIYGHLRRLILRMDYLVAHLIGVPFVFLLPALVTWWAGRRGRRSQAGTRGPDTDSSLPR